VGLAPLSQRGTVLPEEEDADDCAQGLARDQTGDLKDQPGRSVLPDRDELVLAVAQDLDQ
jgi:hypothetical protein